MQHYRSHRTERKCILQLLNTDLLQPDITYNVYDYRLRSQLHFMYSNYSACTLGSNLLTKFQMCTQAALLDRFWGRVGNLTGLDIVQHRIDFTVACTQHRIIYINIKLYKWIECVAVCAPTSFRLIIRDAMHDDMVKEQGLVVDFYVAREETSEVMHISIHIHSIMKGGKTQYTKMQTQFVIFLYFLALFSDHHHFKAYLYFGAIKRKYMYMI